MGAELTFDNGMRIAWEHGLDGGGSTQYKDFLHVLNKMNRFYSCGLEWCSGLGAIGYSIMDSGMCDNFSFMDSYPRAEIWMNVNAITNSLREKVNFIHADAIHKIPKDMYFDLVVGNPPHCMTYSTEMDNNPHTSRLLLDDQWKIHIEFFTNIKKYLIPGADILLSETNPHPEHIKLAQSNGLKFKGSYDSPELAKCSDTPAVIMHYRYET